jgi:tetratricopeptide (TPR) repeat protein
LAIQPDYADAHNNVGAALQARGNISEAIAHFQEALAIKPDNAETHVNLALALRAQGRTAEAKAHLQRATEIQPSRPAPCVRLALLLGGQGRPAEAIAQYRKALTVQPDFLEAHNNLAWLRATCPEASLRNAGDAIEHAQRANQLADGNRPDLMDTLAAAYAEAGRFPEALATARKALALAKQQNNRALADALRFRIALYEAK